MITEITDFSKVTMNTDDVLMETTVVPKNEESLIILDSMNENDKKEFEKYTHIIKAVGEGVTDFKVGQEALLKSNSMVPLPINMDKENVVIGITGKHNIALTIDL